MAFEEEVIGDITKEEMPKEKEERMRYVESLFYYFENHLLPIIQKKDMYRENADRILHNKEELRKHDKRWLALGIIYQTYNELKNDPHLFINRLKTRIREIESYDKKLAEYIMKIGVDNREIAVLNELAVRLKAIPEEQAIFFIRKYYRYYLREFNKFNDKKAVDELKRALFLITGEEIYYLNRYLEEVRQWPLLARTEGIGYFTKRLNVYLKNNFGGYKGLASDFRDREITNMVLGNKAVRRLFNYEEEERFFDNVMDYIIKVRRSRNWIADFVDLDGKKIRMSYYEKGGFHDNLKGHRNFIKTVKEDFSNKEFADFLEYLEKKYRELPSEEVQLRITELDRLLKSAEYQIRNVILPATEGLITIFNKRIYELERKRGEGLGGLKRFLDGRIKEIEKSPQRNARRLMRKTWIEELKIGFYWSNIRWRFDQKDLRILRMLARFAGYAMLLERYDPSPTLMRIKKINDAKTAWIKYMHERAKKLANLKVAAKGIPHLMIAATTLEESIKQIEEHSSVIEESVLNKAPEIIKYVIKKARKLNRALDELILFLIKTGVISKEDIERDNLKILRFPQKKLPESEIKKLAA